MPKWEYMILWQEQVATEGGWDEDGGEMISNADFENGLNSYGKRGWEVYHITDQLFYLKRPLS